MRFWKEPLTTKSWRTEISGSQLPSPIPRIASLGLSIGVDAAERIKFWIFQTKWSEQVNKATNLDTKSLKVEINKGNPVQYNTDQSFACKAGIWAKLFSSSCWLHVHVDLGIEMWAFFEKGLQVLVWMLHIIHSTHLSYAVHWQLRSPDVNSSNSHPACQYGSNGWAARHVIANHKVL